MKLIAFVILGMGMMGSAVVQAQESGQGSAVPRQPVLVAQGGTLPPVWPQAVSPAAPSMVIPVVIGVGVIAAVAASGSPSSSTHH